MGFWTKQEITTATYIPKATHTAMYINSTFCYNNVKKSAICVTKE